MNHSLKSTFAVAFAVLMMTTPVAATGIASQPLQAGPLDFGAPDAPDDVVRYTADAVPGVFVTVSSSEDLVTLDQWANASADRTVVERYNATNTYLIAAPVTELASPLTSLSGWVSGERTISELGYVKSWSWDRQVEFSEPVRNLAADDTFSRPRAAIYAEALTDGEYTASAMAWSDDAPGADLNDTRRVVGADNVSATGAGVDVAVIDSGVNFGNGTLYGDGTAGSEMRVSDAYDFVDGESVNLSVTRENLPDELANVADPNGHGSWVSSAVLNARSGIAPEANLMAYRALNSEGQGSTSDIRKAISRANEQGADVLIMSLGSPMWSDGMAEELRYALSEDGNVTGAFIAVGNSYTTTRYISSPADVDGVIGVSATPTVKANNSKKAYFANTGPDTGLDGSEFQTKGVRPDTAAPGMNITAPVFDAPSADGGRMIDSQLSGTSMAAPIAGGVGALLLDAEPGLKGSPEEFRERLVNSGAHTPNIGITESRGGMINATRAIDGYAGEDAPDRELTPETEGRDAANRLLAGDVGSKLATISRYAGGLV